MPRTKQFGSKVTASLPKRLSEVFVAASHDGVDRLSRLSEELLEHIALEISLPGDLRALSMTSRSLHRIVIPHFFAHIDLRPEARHTKNSGNIVQSHASRSQEASAKFRSFAVLILRRPDLARLVRSFCMRPGFKSDRELEIAENPQYPPSWVEIDPVLEEAVKSHAHSEEEEKIWIRALKRQEFGVDELNDDPVLALLLPCFPNLKRLALQMPDHAPYLERMMDCYTAGVKPFDTNLVALSQLQNIGSTYWEDHYGMEPFWFARCLRLPSVKRIFMHFVGTGSGNMGGNQVDEHLARLPPRSSPCQHIELRNSKLSDHDIRKTLEACLLVRTFMYELGWGHLSWSHPNIQKLMNALSLHEDSLENLSLDLKHYGEIGDDNILFAPISLANFPHLKHVKINPVFLTGRTKSDNFTGDTPRRTDLATKLPELFPPSLERLCVMNAQKSFRDVVTGLEKLLLRKHSDHPVLRELVLEGPWSAMSDYWSPLNEISMASQRASVVFIARDNRYPGRNDAVGGGLKQRWGVNDEFCWVELGSKAKPFEIFDVHQSSLRSG